MISVVDVRKRFGPLVAVDGLSFEVNRGEVVGFLGPNGAGKTTTMRMLTGTLQPDEGVVLFDGKPISDDLIAAKRRVGYLPESNPLYDEMLVAEYLEYVGELRDLDRVRLRPAVSDAVDETGISEVFYRPIGELSKGYRQRVGMAAAILHRPEVLILDEPTEGLDPNQRVDIRSLVVNLGKERTILLSTHVMQEVEATCNRLLILRRGRLVAKGSVRELLDMRSGLTRYQAEIEGTDVVAALGQLPGVTSVTAVDTEGRTRIQLEVRDGEELRPVIYRMAVDRGWVLWELRREQASLEEVFRNLTREGGDTEAVLPDPDPASEPVAVAGHDGEPDPESPAVEDER